MVVIHALLLGSYRKSKTLCTSTQKCFKWYICSSNSICWYIENNGSFGLKFCRAEFFFHTVSSFIFYQLPLYVKGFICIHIQGSSFSLFYHLYVFWAPLYTYIAEFPEEELAGPSPLVLGLEDLLRHVQDPLDTLSVLVLLLPAHLDILHQHMVRHLVLSTARLR